jgi:hypothetical protein
MILRVLPFPENLIPGFWSPGHCFDKRGIGMPGDLLARQWRVIRAIEASPDGLSIAEIALLFPLLGIFSASRHSTPPFCAPRVLVREKPSRQAAKSAKKIAFPSSTFEEKVARLRFQNGTSKTGRGGSRYLPYAFTEQGVAMLSSVLRSNRAVLRTRDFRPAVLGVLCALA